MKVLGEEEDQEEEENEDGILRRTKCCEQAIESAKKHARRARAMKEKGNSGSIVNISSVAGLEGTRNSSAYGASKWAVRGMTKVAALELGRFNIRVNSVHPGLIDTDMMQELPYIQAGKLDRVVKTIPLGRTATADEVAQLVLFLASDESSYCTGSEYAVDGGVHH